MEGDRRYIDDEPLLDRSWYERKDVAEETDGIGQTDHESGESDESASELLLPASNLALPNITREDLVLAAAVAWRLGLESGSIMQPDQDVAHTNPVHDYDHQIVGDLPPIVHRERTEERVTVPPVRDPRPEPKIVRRPLAPNGTTTDEHRLPVGSATQAFMQVAHGKPNEARARTEQTEAPDTETFYVSPDQGEASVEQPTAESPVEKADAFVPTHRRSVPVKNTEPLRLSDAGDAVKDKFHNASEFLRTNPTVQKFIEKAKKDKLRTGLWVISGTAIAVLALGATSDKEEGDPDAGALPEGPTALELIEKGEVPQNLENIVVREATMTVNADTRWRVLLPSHQQYVTLADAVDNPETKDIDESTNVFKAGLTVPVVWDVDVPVSGPESAVTVSEPDESGIRTLTVNFEAEGLNVDGKLAIDEIPKENIDEPIFFNGSADWMADAMEKSEPKPQGTDITNIVNIFNEYSGDMTGLLAVQGLVLAESGEELAVLQERVLATIVDYYGAEGDQFRVEAVGELKPRSGKELAELLALKMPKSDAEEDGDKEDSESDEDKPIVSLVPESGKVTLIEAGAEAEQTE